MRRDEDRGSFQVLGARAQPEGHRRRVPVGKLVCVTGVSGSGKSTLVNEIVYKALAEQLQRDRRPRSVEASISLGKVIEIDQTPIGRTPRSNPHVHRPVHARPRALLAEPRGQGARLQGQPLLFNDIRGRCRDVQGQRADQDRDALPPDVYVLRSVTGVATTARRSRFGSRQDRSSPTCSRCPSRRRSSSSRRSRRSAGGCRRSTTSGSTTSASASRRRRSRGAGAAGRLAAELLEIAAARTLYILDEADDRAPRRRRKLLEVLSGSWMPATRCS